VVPPFLKMKNPNKLMDLHNHVSSSYQRRTWSLNELKLENTTHNPSNFSKGMKSTNTSSFNSRANNIESSNLKLLMEPQLSSQQSSTPSLPYSFLERSECPESCPNLSSTFWRDFRNELTKQAREERRNEKCRWSDFQSSLRTILTPRSSKSPSPT